jgi:hypothetical protein
MDHIHENLGNIQQNMDALQRIVVSFQNNEGHVDADMDETAPDGDATSGDDESSANDEEGSLEEPLGDIEDGEMDHEDISDEDDEHDHDEDGDEHDDEEEDDDDHSEHTYDVDAHHDLDNSVLESGPNASIGEFGDDAFSDEEDALAHDDEHGHTHHHGHVNDVSAIDPPLAIMNNMDIGPIEDDEEFVFPIDSSIIQLKNFFSDDEMDEEEDDEDEEPDEDAMMDIGDVLSEYFEGVGGNINEWAADIRAISNEINRLNVQTQHVPTVIFYCNSI